jgi:hypothetical protein
MANGLNHTLGALYNFGTASQQDSSLLRRGGRGRRIKAEPIFPQTGGKAVLKSQTGETEFGHWPNAALGV